MPANRGPRFIEDVTILLDQPTDLRPPTPTVPMRRRDEVAFVVFSLWTISGLFLDGWAHGQGKPETFFTPWHGLLYSGFVAGMAWTLYERARTARRGEAMPPPDRLVLAGGGLFAMAGVADMVWHTIFGIEEDLEALLSPSHLLLMLAGLLLTTAPLRAPWPTREPSFRAIAPKVAGLALSSAIVSFFLMFANPFVPFQGAPEFHAAALLLTNATIVGPLVWLSARVRLPRGAVLAHLAIVITFALSLEGFERWPLLLAALGGGVAGELARDLTRVGFAAAVSIGTWAAYYLAVILSGNLDVTVELWTGPVVLAALSSAAIALLATPVGVGGVRSGRTDRGS